MLLNVQNFERATQDHYRYTRDMTQQHSGEHIHNIYPLQAVLT